MILFSSPDELLIAQRAGRHTVNGERPHTYASDTYEGLSSIFCDFRREKVSIYFLGSKERFFNAKEADDIVKVN